MGVLPRNPNADGPRCSATTPSPLLLRRMHGMARWKWVWRPGVDSPPSLGPAKPPKETRRHGGQLREPLHPRPLYGRNHSQVRLSIGFVGRPSGVLYYFYCRQRISASGTSREPFQPQQLSFLSSPSISSSAIRTYRWKSFPVRLAPILPQTNAVPIGRAALSIRQASTSVLPEAPANRAKEGTVIQ